MRHIIIVISCKLIDPIFFHSHMQVFFYLKPEITAEADIQINNILC